MSGGAPVSAAGIVGRVLLALAGLALGAIGGLVIASSLGWLRVFTC